MTLALARNAARGHHPFRPVVESLEERWTPSVTFAGQQTFATGAVPYAVAVGDFNGDGRPDFVVLNRFDKTVSVFLNTTAAGSATPSFAAQDTFAVGDFPEGIAVGDFNCDGRPDLAITNFNDKTVSVLLNTTAAGSGTASFAPQQTFAVGLGPTAVAVGDFNGDGRTDIAVANHLDSTVSVLLNTTPSGSGTASFAPQKTFAVSTLPNSLAVGDFAGDGRTDLAVASYVSNSVSVLLNTTASGAVSPSFAPQQTFSVFSPTSITVGDFSGDGRPDLAVASDTILSGTVSVLLNTTAAGSGTVTFAAHQDFEVGKGPQTVIAGDFDGDGRTDLATANTSDGTVSVLLNTTTAGSGTASFAAHQDFAVGGVPFALSAADFNGDGRSDFAVANQFDNSVSVLLNTTMLFASATPVVVGQFGTQGVWEFNRARGTWVELTPSNASLLAADAQGDVVGEFPGYGLQLYRPASGWRQLNGVDATALAMNAAGDVVAQFPGYGVGEYLPASGWRSLTPSNATLLAIDAQGDVVGEFPGYGVQLYRPASGWQPLNGVDASLLAMDAQGDIVANFAGFGVGEFQPASGWRSLNGNQALSLTVDEHGNFAAVFQGYGTAMYYPATGWRSLVPINAAAAAVDALGDVYADFAGSGVWEYDLYRGWCLLNAADASVLAVA